MKKLLALVIAAGLARGEKGERGAAGHGGSRTAVNNT